MKKPCQVIYLLKKYAFTFWKQNGTYVYVNGFGKYGGRAYMLYQLALAPTWN